MASAEDQAILTELEELLPKIDAHPWIDHGAIRRLCNIEDQLSPSGLLEALGMFIAQDEEELGHTLSLYELARIKRDRAGTSGDVETAIDYNNVRNAAAKVLGKFINRSE